MDNDAFDLPIQAGDDYVDESEEEATVEEDVSNDLLEGNALRAANAWLKGELGTLSEDPNAVIPIPHSQRLLRLEIALCTLAGLCESGSTKCS